MVGLSFFLSFFLLLCRGFEFGLDFWDWIWVWDAKVRTGIGISKGRGDRLREDARSGRSGVCLG